jgi:hypothetical protein
MADGKLLVVVIRTPKSDRYLPIESLFKDDQRFKLEYIEASMTPTYSEVSNRGIAFSTEIFEYLQGRKLTPAEIGCADSHNRARDLIQSHASGGVILEDDARITNVDSFFIIATDFLSSQKSKLSILNFTGFKQIGLEKSRGELPKKNRYIKIWGNPDLAVSYALTNKAAAELLKSNQPIIDVSDWPKVKCNFFVPLRPPVKHGDATTSSLIDSTKLSFRKNASLSRKLWHLTFIMYFDKRPKGVSLLDLIRVIYGKRIKWRYDYLKIKIKSELMN